MDPMLLLLVIFAVMMIPMFLMSSRQRKRQRELQEQISKLGVGDEVRTHSGFYGLIVEELGDQVILESEDGSQLKWARAAIAGKVDPAEGVEAPDDASELDEAGTQTTGEDTASDRDGVPGVTTRDDDRR